MMVAPAELTESQMRVAELSGVADTFMAIGSPLGATVVLRSAQHIIKQEKVIAALTEQVKALRSQVILQQ